MLVSRHRCGGILLISYCVIIIVMIKNFDFIAIGDITTDAFIKLKRENAHVMCDTRGRKCQICMDFGEKIEYESVTEVPSVGNSPNAAVAVHRLGLSSALVTNLGDDYNGKKCLEQLEKEGVNTSFVKIHAGMESNYHYVLWYEEERTILVKHQEYPYALPDIDTPQWMYLSSLGKHSLPFHQEIASFLRSHPETKLSFQPGTFQIQSGYEALKDIYTLSHLFFCNLQEARRILKRDGADIKELLEGIHELGPKIVSITDGPAGAYAYDGETTWHIPMYPDPAPPVSRTGAGDAFASTFTAMLALGKTVPEALTYAPVNSMSVVQKVGAQKGLLTLQEIEAWLAKAPAEYKPKKI